MAPKPAGNPRVRGVDAVTRSSFALVSFRRRWIAVVLILIVCATATALAQDEKTVERAIKAPLASRSLLLDAARAGDALVVVGERGHILISSDAGATWRQADVPTRSTLTGVYFHDRNLGWAVGHDSVILRTSDGGASWQRVHWAPEDNSPLLDVWFADAKKGLAIGAYGGCWTTVDGGTTWTRHAISEDDFHLNQIARGGNGRLYIAAEAGHVYRSDNDGETWTKLASPYAGSFFGVLPLEGDTVLLFGLRGHLLRSEDGGQSWTAIETGTVAMLNSGIRLPDGRVVIVGLGGVVLVSDDSGRTFKLRQQSSRAGIQGLVDAGNGQLLLVGESGVRQLPVSDLSNPRGQVTR